MPQGPGKYDPECLQVLHDTGAATVVLIVLQGDRGSGFSVTSLVTVEELPALLRTVADQIERSSGRETILH